MIKIKVFGKFREFVGKPLIELNCSECRIIDILKRIIVDDKALLDIVLEGNKIRKSVRILVNGVDIRKLDGLDTAVKDGDSILIGPPLSAGGMVDITAKPFSFRLAEAEGIIHLRKQTIELIKSGKVEKGDVFEAVKIAAINAVKSTPHILAYCHPIKITNVKVLTVVQDDSVKVNVIVKSIEQTGVEMEALTGVMAGLLTIWDMVKKYEKDESGNYPDTWISNVRVIRKEKLDIK